MIERSARKTEEAVLYESRYYEQQVHRYVEAELYSYPYRKQDIERVRDDIINATSDHSTRTEGVGNPTLLRAMQLLTSKRLERLAENHEVVTRVYERLDPVRKRLVEMRYWEREYTDYGIYHRLHISRSTYFRWRDEVLKAIAIEMGLL